jgi:uncharacterized protein YhhL (DUF1145 family)
MSHKQDGYNCCCTLWASNYDRWTCMCCKYPNGAIPVLLLQIFGFLSFALSVLTIFDCRLFVIDDELRQQRESEQGFLNGSLPTINGTRGVGYYTFGAGGKLCYEPGNETGLELFGYYNQEFLGEDWRQGRVFAAFSCTLAFGIWAWCLSFACISYPQRVRCIISTTYVFLTLTQGMALMPLHSQFCSEFHCQIDRTTYLLIGAICCHIASAASSLCMKSFPGSDLFGSTGDREETHIPQTELPSVTVSREFVYPTTATSPNASSNVSNSANLIGTGSIPQDSQIVGQIPTVYVESL